MKPTNILSELVDFSRLGTSVTGTRSMSNSSTWLLLLMYAPMIAFGIWEIAMLIKSSFQKDVSSAFSTLNEKIIAFSGLLIVFFIAAVVTGIIQSEWLFIGLPLLILISVAGYDLVLRMPSPLPLSMATIGTLGASTLMARELLAKFILADDETSVISSNMQSLFQPNIFSSNFGEIVLIVCFCLMFGAWFFRRNQSLLNITVSMYRSVMPLVVVTALALSLFFMKDSFNPYQEQALNIFADEQSDEEVESLMEFLTAMQTPETFEMQTIKPDTLYFVFHGTNQSIQFYNPQLHYYTQGVWGEIQSQGRIQSQGLGAKKLNVKELRSVAEKRDSYILYEYSSDQSVLKSTLNLLDDNRKVLLLQGEYILLSPVGKDSLNLEKRSL
jgi:cytochrome c biogenesis protein CcdA